MSCLAVEIDGLLIAIALLYCGTDMNSFDGDG